MERKAVNCAEVHSADWISILCAKSKQSYMRVCHRSRICNVHSMLVSETCKYRLWRKTIPIENSYEFFPRIRNVYILNANIAGQNQFNIDQRKFVNESQISSHGDTLTTHVISNLQNGYFFVRKKLFFRLHTRNRKTDSGETHELFPTFSSKLVNVSRV